MHAIRISQKDNVATMLEEVAQGGEVTYQDGLQNRTCTAAENIAFGHKIALVNILKGEPVIKYGEVIGVASEDIFPGFHVHTDNLESCRGRGDKEDVPVSQPGLKAADADCNEDLQPAETPENLTFLGYRRADGSVGTRNFVAVISCVVCANEVASKLGEIEGAACFTHQQGCSQTMPDIERIKSVLINLAVNPNVGAVVYVSLGCESVPSEEVCREAAARSGKPVELICLQKDGGLDDSVSRGAEIIRKLKERINIPREAVPVSKLKLGLKCGSSDTTQGLSANVIAGKITDRLVRLGASVVIGETTEFLGAEHIAARHARTAEVAAKITGYVQRMENRAKAVGVDMRGGQPTRGNIAGGLTTIEEKSLGALAKAGSAVFNDAVEYGEVSAEKGLVFMDSPGREPEMLTGLAAAGCNLILFTTGRGAPQGFPFVPVVKVTGNERTFKNMNQHMDISVARVMDGSLSAEQAAGDLMKRLLAFASGEKTKAELCAYNNSMNIYVTGPVI
jgi:altronate dehydratase large subunit